MYSARVAFGVYPIAFVSDEVTESDEGHCTEDADNRPGYTGIPILSSLISMRLDKATGHTRKKTTFVVLSLLPCKDGRA